MQKILFLILAFMLCLGGTAFAKTYDLCTAPTTADSGNTTVANGGTSVFYIALNGGASPYAQDGVDFYPLLDRIYAYGFQLSHVTPSQALYAVGYWTGVTFSVYAKFKSNAGDVSWDAIEPTYLIKDLAVNSSTTPQAIWIKPPPADQARFYFVTEGGGATVFGLAKGKLIASEIPSEITEPLIVVKEGTFTMPVAGTGVSQFTAASIGAWTSGAVAATFDIVSGASAFYTTNGDTPTTTTGIPLLSPFTYSGGKGVTIEDPIVRNVKFIAGGAATVIRYRLLNRKP